MIDGMLKDHKSRKRQIAAFKKKHAKAFKALA